LHPVSRRDSAFIAPTGSCANPKPPPRLGITLAHGVFTGCYQPLLGVGPSRHYLCESFPTCLDPYPGGPQGAFTRFFPQGIGLPRSCSGSALHIILDSHFSPGGLFGAAAISSCSGPPVCLPPRWLPPPRPFQAPGSRGFYFWAPHSSLPPRGPDRLAVRIEQLTAGRLALPKIRSLVGCSGRVAVGISAHRYVPPPSQNRTWRVTPSGSQREAFTAANRPLCEVGKLRGHAHSPLSVGACLLYPLSHAGTPSLPPRYRSSSLLWAPPTSSDLPSHSSLLRLVVGRALFRASHWISTVTTHSPFKLDRVYNPGWAPLARLLRSRCCCLLAS